MKKFKVLISQTAQKQLFKLDTKSRNRIKQHIQKLAINPYQNRSKVDIKKLSGSFNPELYRLRVGDFRVIYAIIGEEVRVTEIIHRGKGYEWLG